MGVKNLWDVLESCKKTVPLHHLQNKRVCVDLSCWMVQLHNVSKSHACVKEKVYLRCLFHRLRALIALNCTLVFVADGSIPAIKLSTYRRRLNVGKEVAQNDTNLQKMTSLRRNMGSEFSCMIKEAKVVGMALGISCLNGIEEAEAQCALLNFESLCDGCFSSDSDIFLFGARSVYRDICLGDGGYVVCYEMTDIERKLGFGRESLIALSLLLGSDYYPGVHGLGPESACKLVKSIGDKYILKKFASEGLGWVKKRKGGANDLRKDDNILQVINAYMKPKCHSADSDIVHKALAQYPFQRTRLQQICAEFFEWPLEKTDGYILPSIAERDLRRFANLRLTSSEVGLNLPLHEIPVKCPVSEIIKSRRVQGRECYEVSWEGMDGLETSILPADLIESACREKILEFEERKAQRKKQNNPKRRPKKKETTSSVAELDLKLQNLLLDDDFRDQANFNASDSSGSILKITTTMDEADLNTVDLLHLSHDIEHTELIHNISNIHSNETVSSRDKNQIIDLLSPSPPKKQNNPKRRPKKKETTSSVAELDLKLQNLLLNDDFRDQANFNASDSSGSISKITTTMDEADLNTVDLLHLSHDIEHTELIHNISNIHSNETVSSRDKNQIIDLLSPSPPKKSNFSSKCQQSSDQHIEVIDLSDSENDMSVAHKQKAKELRLFLASIRNEIH